MAPVTLQTEAEEEGEGEEIQPLSSWGRGLSTLASEAASRAQVK